MTLNILRVDASARLNGSISRDLNDKIVARYQSAGPVDVVTRDLTQSLPFLDEEWIGANFTDDAERTPEQREKLAVSNALVSELKEADVVLIGLPIYNFGVPAALKAWVDLVARRGLTFNYTENGPVGLLEGKRAIITVASGGTEAGSDIDFATGYMRHVLKFIGITDVIFVSADRMAIDPETTLRAAEDAVANLPIAA